jgi:hypothetical protein
MPRSKQMAHAQLDQLRQQAADERMKQRDSRERTVTPPVATLRNEERHRSFDPLVDGSSYRLGLSSLSCFPAATGSGSLPTERGWGCFPPTPAIRTPPPTSVGEKRGCGVKTLLLA